MDKFQLRHKILEEIYKLPNNPTDKEHPNWIMDFELKKRIKGTYSNHIFHNELKYLSAIKEIDIIPYNEGKLNIHSKKDGVQAYLDNYYLDKRRDEKRNTTQHNLKVTAWSIGIILGTATFILNLYKLNQDIYIVPLLEHRIESLESNIKQEKTFQHPTTQYNVDNKKDS